MAGIMDAATMAANGKVVYLILEVTASK